MTPSFRLSLGAGGEGSTGGGGRGVESKPSAREAVAGPAKGRAGGVSRRAKGLASVIVVHSAGRAVSGKQKRLNMRLSNE